MVDARRPRFPKVWDVTGPAKGRSKLLGFIMALLMERRQTLIP